MALILTGQLGTIDSMLGRIALGLWGTAHAPPVVITLLGSRDAVTLRGRRTRDDLMGSGSGTAALVGARGAIRLTGSRS